MNIVARPSLEDVPNLGQNAAKCRQGAERCHVHAVNAFDQGERDTWLAIAADWICMAEEFDARDRSSLN
jgi:hypothetical protein